MGLTATYAGNKKYDSGDKKDQYVEDKFIHINDGKPFNAGICLLAANDKPSGLPQQFLVVNGKVTIDGKEFVQPILQITEGTKEKGLSTYILAHMSKVAFDPAEFN